MEAARVIVESLSLPRSARLDKRVPKKLLLERGAPTAADKRAIQDGVGEIRWIASLKPGNLNIPAYESPQHVYSEIAVLHVAFRPKAKVARLQELIHRAIPYPLALAGEVGGRVFFCLAEKRRSEAEKEKFVLEALPDSTGLLDPVQLPPGYEDLLIALDCARQPSANLRDFYRGWVDCVLAFLAVEARGMYIQNDMEPEVVRGGLESRAVLWDQIASVRSQARKEKQISRQVELNIQLKALEKQLADGATLL